MKDYVYLGSAPIMEQCAQVGQPGYENQALKECKRFAELLRKRFGKEPEGAQIVMKEFEHDFGNYFEVVCVFEIGNEEAANYAYNIEANLPEFWD